MMAFVLAETKDSETGWHSDPKKAGVMESSMAEMMAFALAQTKDSETGWHLDLKKAGSMVAKKADDLVPK